MTTYLINTLDIVPEGFPVPKNRRNALGGLVFDRTTRHRDLSDRMIREDTSAPASSSRIQTALTKRWMRNVCRLGLLPDNEKIRCGYYAEN